MMPGPPPDGDDEPVMLRVESRGPLGQHARQHARVLVVSRPLDRLAAALEMRVRSRCRLPGMESPLEPFERFARLFRAVNPRRSEEDDGVLDVLGLEPAQRFEILGENAKRPCLLAFEEL